MAGLVFLFLFWKPAEYLPVPKIVFLISDIKGFLVAVSSKVDGIFCHPSFALGLQ